VKRFLVLSALAVAGFGIAGAWWPAGSAPLLPADRNTPVTYVALGDSTVEGVGASRPEATYVGRLFAELRAVYPFARLENLGKGGATSADVIARQLPRALAARPDLVTLSVGPNDITTRQTVENYERNLATIFAALREQTGAVVVASLIPDLGVTPRFRGSPERDAVARRSVLFNDALRRRARSDGAVLVDLYTASRREVPRRPELVGRDGYHPSDLGYARWAELMWQVIRKRIGGADRQSHSTSDVMRSLAFAPPLLRSPGGSCMLAG
jgi:lysophospholipase L1-like esterase